MASYVAARETVSQDERNAERYDRTQTALEKSAASVSIACAPRLPGNTQALIEFVAAVNEQISLEHRQWVESSEASKAAVAKLEERCKGQAAEENISDMRTAASNEEASVA